MERVATEHAPGAIGPYSQAIIANGFVYTAGQIALDPATGQVVEGGIAEQTKRVMANLKAVLEAAGSSFSQVVKTTVFLVDMADFSAMNEVYAKAFGEHKPSGLTGIIDDPCGDRFLQRHSRLADQSLWRAVLDHRRVRRRVPHASIAARRVQLSSRRGRPPPARGNVARGDLSEHAPGAA